MPSSAPSAILDTLVSVDHRINAAAIASQCWRESRGRMRQIVEKPLQKSDWVTDALRTHHSMVFGRERFSFSIMMS